MAGGHCISVGSCRYTAYNMHNIHKQSYQSNSEQGGDNLKYRKGLKKRYGNLYADFVENLTECGSIKPTKQDLIELNRKLRTLKKELLDRVYLVQLDSNDRIELRNWLNKEIGLYPEKYCTFIV